jgi:hypothetical protein
VLRQSGRQGGSTRICRRHVFRWYCRAALTIVHLLGVLSDSQREADLWKRIWNTRGWTYQEYVASSVIQFYTENWKPYLGLDIPNHKESPIILLEMEQATEFATERLATIKPGLDRLREKLYLASKRETTREENIAYSLFGIFDVSPPIIYGEGKRAVRRLLQHILTQSDDVALLSWTGNSGSTTKSYLSSDLTVHDQILPPHVPQTIEDAEVNRIVTDLQSCFPDPSPVVMLYERLLDLTSLSLVSGRLRLPRLVLRLTHLTRLAASESDSSLHIYRATAPILGEVLIEAKDNSLGMQRLVLVHPWINPLLDEDFSGDDPIFDLDERALRILVRLRQPCGALLLASQKRGSANVWRRTVSFRFRFRRRRR